MIQFFCYYNIDDFAFEGMELFDTEAEAIACAEHHLQVAVERLPEGMTDEPIIRYGQLFGECVTYKSPAPDDAAYDETWTLELEDRKGPDLVEAREAIYTAIRALKTFENTKVKVSQFPGDPHRLKIEVGEVPTITKNLAVDALQYVLGELDLDLVLVLDYQITPIPEPLNESAPQAEPPTTD